MNRNDLPEPESLPLILSPGEIYHGDCLDLLRGVEPGSVDMVLADLPYGTTNLKWDILIPFEKLWPELLRVGKKNCAFVFTAQQPFATDLINSNRKMFRCEWIWEKTLPLGALSANKRPMLIHENILIFGTKIEYHPQMTDAPPRRVGGALGRKDYHYATRYASRIQDKGKFPNTILRYSNGHAGKSEHGTQKPVGLFEYLIRTYTNPGDIVLDPTCGSGTAAVAAIRCGRNFICLEQEEKFVAIARRRIEEERAQGVIFERGKEFAKTESMFERESISEVNLMGDSTL